MVPLRGDVRRSPRIASNVNSLRSNGTSSAAGELGTSTPPDGFVEVTLGDGSVRYIRQDFLDQATIGRRDATPACPYTHLLIFDSGWGGIDMVVALAKIGYAAIVHIKGAHALFPIAQLEENLRGFPGGSHLEMKAEVDGVTLIAVGYKYNSKGTLYFLAPEGAATTLAGTPYITKWPDEDLNVQYREVPRPALPARYYECFMDCDKHNQDRQHELNLESNWPTDDPFFRISCTIDGMTAVDAMLAVRCTSHMSHPVRDLTTKEFIENLAEEMLENKLDGERYEPSYGLKRRRSQIVGVVTGNEETESSDHILLGYGRKSDFDPKITKNGEGDYIIQKKCSVCNKKATTYCSRKECKCMIRGQMLPPTICRGNKEGKSCLLEHIRLQQEKETGPDDEEPVQKRQRRRK